MFHEYYLSILSYFLIISLILVLSAQLYFLCMSIFVLACTCVCLYLFLSIFVSHSYDTNHHCHECVAKQQTHQQYRWIHPGAGALTFTHRRSRLTVWVGASWSRCNDFYMAISSSLYLSVWVVASLCRCTDLCSTMSSSVYPCRWVYPGASAPTSTRQCP